ncbi:MAG: class I SAM-dependent rRNA methyltransferase [Verrucomicrobia bacterium]|nr:class I SAM-dependent rRNA methyltransferase [Verrucomicrobiota bacterium]
MASKSGLPSCGGVFHDAAVEISVLVSEWEGHRLLDTGDGFKLEEIGGVRMVRSEPKAWWSKALPDSEWNKAVAVHEEAGRDSRWKLHGNCPKEWETKLGQLRFQLRFMDNSKQFGVFAEQSPHWKWVSQQKQTGEQRPRLLNLFGYTGAASLVAAQAGWHVTHVDASKPAVAWGRRNQELSGMAEAPIRWIIEDAMTFVKREVKRGNQYEAIMLDPPAFGRGPNGEFWKVERDLAPLLRACRDLLSPQAKFLLLTVYTIDASSILCHNLLEETTLESIRNGLLGLKGFLPRLSVSIMVS